MVDIRKKVGMPRRCGYFRSPFCYGVTVMKIVEKLAIGMMGKKFPKTTCPLVRRGDSFCAGKQNFCVDYEGSRVIQGSEFSYHRAVSRMIVLYTYFLQWSHFNHPK